MFQAAKPFNHKLKWLGTDVAAWETVEPDITSTPAPPAPGSMQFHETVSFSTPACSIGATRWSATSSTASSAAGIAILLKAHHALIDGEGGPARDAQLPLRFTGRHDAGRSDRRRAPTGHAHPATVSRAGRKLQGQLQGMTGADQAAERPVRRQRDAADPSALILRDKASLPFTARRTVQHGEIRRRARTERRAAARRRRKALAMGDRHSANDVVMTVIDDALHSPNIVAFTTGPLRRSCRHRCVRSRARAVANGVSAELVPMGAPKRESR